MPELAWGVESTTGFRRAVVALVLMARFIGACFDVAGITDPGCSQYSHLDDATVVDAALGDCVPTGCTSVHVDAEGNRYELGRGLTYGA